VDKLIVVKFEGGERLVQLLPTPMLKIQKRIPIGNNGDLRVHFKYECPLSDVAGFYKPPHARMLIRCASPALISIRSPVICGALNKTSDLEAVLGGFNLRDTLAMLILVGYHEVRGGLCS
jgi:hypothetical protein